MQAPSYLPLLINPYAPITINAQIIGQILLLITVGELGIGVPLPSVTQLAKQLDINPNTIATVYRNLSEAGYVVGQRGRGTFVANTEQVAKLRNSAHLGNSIEQAFSLALIAGLTPDMFSAIAYASALSVLQKYPPLKLVFVGFSQIDQQLYQQVKAEISIPLKFISGLNLEIDRSRDLGRLLDADLVITSQQKLWDTTSVTAPQQEVVVVEAKPSVSLLETFGTLPYHTKVLLIGQTQLESKEMERIFNNAGVNHLNFQPIPLPKLADHPNLLLQANKICVLIDLEEKVQQLNTVHVPLLPFEVTLDSNRLLILKARITAIQTTKEIAQEI